MFIATYKDLWSLTRKNGNEYIGYFIGNKEGCSKSISPIKWTKLKLPDKTTPNNIKDCYTFLSKAWLKPLIFGRQLDLIREAEKQGITLANNPKEFYLYIIAKR